MRILVANDDGITAPGIGALARSLASEHTVFVVAPDRERSAMGHALTLHRPLRAEPFPMGGGIAGAWAISGTPSDCVKLAVSAALLDGPVDLVVSGINRGPNLGTDVLYSGTVSAALEGAINGFPALAFSLASFSDVGYERAAEFALQLVRQIQTHDLPAKFLLNVNVPAQDAPFRGIKVTKLGVRKYQDVFERRQDPRGRTYYWLAGEAIETGEAPDSDVMAVRDNYISLTPIQYDLTHYPLLETVKDWQLGLKAKADVPVP
jgi:5'-nucleotidase